MKKTILLIEDDADIRDALQGALRVEGYTVLTFEHGQAAWDYLEKASPPSLIFLDLMTPVLTGWQFLERARHEKPTWVHVPIVVFSAANLPPGADFTPAVEVLRKPVDLGELFSVVEKQIGG